jgi:hypothetical protein
MLPRSNGYPAERAPKQSFGQAKRAAPFHAFRLSSNSAISDTRRDAGSPGREGGNEGAVAADGHGHAWLGERDSYQLRTVIDDPVLADDDFTVSFTVVAC